MVSIRTLVLAVATAVATAAAGAAGMFDGNSAVRQLTPGNFDRVLGRTSQPTFVKFYAPWCGHCKSLEPEYERAAERTRGVARFYAVNCDEESNRGLCARYNVQGFPTLKVFTEKRSKRGSRRSVDYQGARKASAMAKFARSMLPSLSTKLSGDGLDAFVTGTQLPKAVLLTERSKPGDLWRGVAAHFDRRVQLAHMTSPDGPTLERMGIDRLPAVVVFPDHTDPSTVEVYTGETKYLPLAKFIHATAITRKVAKPPKAQTNPSPLDVQQIETQADLERLCIAPADSSPVPVLCVIGVIALEPEFEESRVEHAQAVSVLESVLSDQRLRSPRAPTQPNSSDDDADDAEIEGGDSAADSAELSPPLRVAWVNALSAAGQQIRTMFGLSDDLPAAVAVSPRKRAAAPYRGAFTSADIVDWADGCYDGRGMRRFTMELSIASQPAAAHDEL
ncbi:hypothetical protein GGF43_004392 [Coemansia sp. RSA 2618]|nr:hypothetical protein GGF43_004392 [Coemansia sp. RSA 2618]